MVVAILVFILGILIGHKLAVDKNMERLVRREYQVETYDVKCRTVRLEGKLIYKGCDW